MFKIELTKKQVEKLFEREFNTYLSSTALTTNSEQISNLFQDAQTNYIYFLNEAAKEEDNSLKEDLQKKAELAKLSFYIHNGVFINSETEEIVPLLDFDDLKSAFPMVLREIIVNPKVKMFTFNSFHSKERIKMNLGNKAILEEINIDKNLIVKNEIKETINWGVIKEKERALEIETDDLFAEKEIRRRNQLIVQNSKKMELTKEDFETLIFLKENVINEYEDLREQILFTKSVKSMTNINGEKVDFITKKLLRGKYFNDAIFNQIEQSFYLSKDRDTLNPILIDFLNEEAKIILENKNIDWSFIEMAAYAEVIEKFFPSKFELLLDEVNLKTVLHNEKISYAEIPEETKKLLEINGSIKLDKKEGQYEITKLVENEKVFYKLTFNPKIENDLIDMDLVKKSLKDFCINYIKNDKNGIDLFKYYTLIDFKNLSDVQKMNLILTASKSEHKVFLNKKKFILTQEIFEELSQNKDLYNKMVLKILRQENNNNYYGRQNSRDTLTLMHALKTYNDTSLSEIERINKTFEIFNKKELMLDQKIKNIYEKEIIDICLENYEYLINDNLDNKTIKHFFAVVLSPLNNNLPSLDKEEVLNKIKNVFYKEVKIRDYLALDTIVKSYNLSYIYQESERAIFNRLCEDLFSFKDEDEYLKKIEFVKFINKDKIEEFNELAIKYLTQSSFHTTRVEWFKKEKYSLCSETELLKVNDILAKILDDKIILETINKKSLLINFIKLISTNLNNLRKESVDRFAELINKFIENNEVKNGLFNEMIRSEFLSSKKMRNLWKRLNLNDKIEYFLIKNNSIERIFDYVESNKIIEVFNKEFIEEYKNKFLNPFKPEYCFSQYGYDLLNSLGFINEKDVSEIYKNLMCCCAVRNRHMSDILNFPMLPLEKSNKKSLKNKLKIYTEAILDADVELSLALDLLSSVLTSYSKEIKKLDEIIVVVSDVLNDISHKYPNMYMDKQDKFLKIYEMFGEEKFNTIKTLLAVKDYPPSLSKMISEIKLLDVQSKSKEEKPIIVKKKI